MTNQHVPPVQLQLRQPFAKRAFRLTREGFEALQAHKARIQRQLGRPVSDSVVLDKLIRENFHKRGSHEYED